MIEFEILVLLGELSRTITEQFNFWIATTFAVVIASYTAGRRLSGSALAVLMKFKPTLGTRLENDTKDT